jgi:hypothetical protein
LPLILLILLLFLELPGECFVPLFLLQFTLGLDLEEELLSGLRDPTISSLLVFHSLLLLLCEISFMIIFVVVFFSKTEIPHVELL